jgi:hypothetical protein
LVLQEAVESGNYAGADIVGPDARPSSVVWVFGKKVWGMIRKSFFKEFAEHGTFVQRLVLVLKRRYETPWVQVEKRLWFVVGIDFDVLILDALLLESDPNSLNKGAKPA